MQTKSISISLSKLIIVITALFIVIAIPFIPTFLNSYINTIQLKPMILNSLMITFYITIPAALILLGSLYILLIHISRSDVFVDTNVQLLKVSSYCCFFAAIVYLFFARLYLFALLISIVIFLGGLILRVMQNVLIQAILIKTENDFTI